MTKHIKEYERLQAEAQRAEEALKDFEQAWSAEKCPHTTGERIVATGYSHKGKLFEIEWIDFSTRYVGGSGYKPVWRARGRVVRKDGTVGLQRAEAFGILESDE